ncbi:MAG: hypothetical protein VYD70_06515 [Planctomycetota bacterium]|nr:hypothetical protein [Planctomycetota bacterium]
MKRVGLVTCLKMPEPDPDEEIQLQSIRDAGGEAKLIAWDDSTVDLASFDLIVLRSCWDYPWREQEFRSWLKTADDQTRVLNPIDVVSWNLHKGYLLDLAEAGVPVVPTRLLQAGCGVEALGRALDEEGWTDYVIKPAVSAGSWLTVRFGVHDQESADRFVSENGQVRDLLLQPYISSVERGGERANVYLAGSWSHSVTKVPRFTGDEEQVGEAEEVYPEDVRVGEQALQCSPGPILYGRVDTVRDLDGKSMVTELELIEPTLFLQQYPPARAVFGAACLRFAEIEPSSSDR